MTSYNNTKDLTDFSWRDELWLQYNPLDEVTVLRDYFALSPFYDPECNNEVAKMRNLDISMLPILPPGVEYVVQSSQEPHLYIIRKQYRYNPTTTTTQAFYYVHTGTVYQAPSLHAAILSRWKRCLFCVTKAFRRIRSDLDPLGEWKSVGGREGSWPGKVPEVKRALAKDQQEKLLEGSRLISGALAK
ncbi:unnamed protein product [Ostreobium quekettii]|uniref:Mediator of RNA polymerase II transcription subunit 6 n=1 Tax=Ostreobium quekettii TaxID=121088 RepID=A0A8S1JA56_9CHLO|nr:unnamed protein product [Ostreobium quekettii]